MIDKQFLRSVSLFKDLNDEELDLVGQCCEEVNLSNEKTVFEERDPADFLFTLAQGKVSLRYNLPSNRESKDNRVASIEPGDAFGWSSLTDDAKYTLSAYCADEKCVALKISRDKLTELLDKNHTIGYKVMRNLSILIGKRFVALQDTVAKITGQNDIDGW